MMGGIALRKGYVDRMGKLCHSLNIRLHVDGQFLHCTRYQCAQPLRTRGQRGRVLVQGTGGPMVCVLVGNAEFIRLAMRAPKRCGGGMRQAGVVAAMGLYAIQHNFDRLAVDHLRAKTLAGELQRHGLQLPNGTTIDTIIVYFALPVNSKVPKERYCQILNAEYGVKLVGGYS
jgi:threonine aldolase